MFKPKQIAVEINTEISSQTIPFTTEVESFDLTYFAEVSGNVYVTNLKYTPKDNEHPAELEYDTEIVDFEVLSLWQDDKEIEVTDTMYNDIFDSLMC